MNVFILKICEYEYGDNTLQQAIKERKIEFNEEECLQLFVQIVCGVLYIHKKKIIHRNIKPSNIVVTKQNIVKISDFGVSCVMDISSNSHTNIGTPHYMSPEMCTGKRYDTQTDLWSCGCILFEMCTSQVPFQAADFSSLVTKICRGITGPIPVQYSADVTDLIRVMLNPDPTLRVTAEMLIKSRYYYY